MIKNKIFKQGIGIAEKSQETWRDLWGGNVNHKSLFWFSDFNGVKIGICSLHYHPAIVSWLCSAISIPCLKILFFYHSSLCAFFLIYSWISLHSQTGHIDYCNITSIITTLSVQSEEIWTAIMETLNRLEQTEHTL